ncbi:MAG: response regulator [Bacteroidales bacterium]|nr:response regulator [Bacteroidales bacterium]
MLFNIAGNAVKFTHEGSIFISVENYDVTDTHHILRFVVKDTGIGIAPDKTATIFDSFTQAENEITRKYGGTGLGLAITKKLVELQGGHIKVDSTPGQGTTFTIEMTFRKSEKNLKADEPILIDTFRQFNHERILVVDDNQINLIVARKFLTKWDLQVDTAENGVEAYELARSNQYRMILMDIQMPEMDGYTASKAIRQYETQIGRPLTPIVALTASALLDVKEKIISSGMNDFITKPFNPKELNYKIGKILTAGNPNINPVNT